MTTRLQLIQRAQVRIGDEPIGAEDDPGADTHVAIYDSVVADLLSRHAWSFATTTRQLTRLVVEPPAHWTYYYQLPSEMIGAPWNVYDSDTRRVPFTAFEIAENRIGTDAETVWLRFSKQADPGIWPGYFSSLVTTVLMAELALSVREDAEMHTALTAKAFGPPEANGRGGMWKEALLADVMAQAPPDIRDRVVEDLLGRHAWSFATATVALSVLGGTPAAHWSKHFALPADRIGVPRAIFNRSDRRGAFAGYEIAGDEVLTNSSSLWARYTRWVAPSKWPASFRDLVETVVRGRVMLEYGGDDKSFEGLMVIAFGPPERGGVGGKFGAALWADAEAQPPVEIWDRVVDDLLGRYPWSFATSTVALVVVEGAPTAHWAKRFALPDNMVGPPRAVFDRSDLRLPFHGYELADDKVLTNATALWMRCTRWVAPERWSRPFARLVETAVRAEVALSFGNRTLYETLHDVAFGSSQMMGEGGLLGQAKNADAQASPSPAVGAGSNPLADARFA